MTKKEPEEGLNEETEVAELEDTEALKQALAEEKARAEANLAGWRRPTLLTTSGAVSRKRRRLASLPTPYLYLAFCQSWMIGNEP